MFLTLVTFIALAGAPLENEPIPTRDWGLSVSLGVASLAPNAGVSAERRISAHWSLELGVQASATSWTLSGAPLTWYSIALQPGVRYYLSDTLCGPWVGLSIPVGLSHGLGGLTGLASLGATNDSFDLGADAHFGWVFRWSNGLLLGISAGPGWRGSWSPVARSGIASTSAFSVSGQLSLGVAL